MAVGSVWTKPMQRPMKNMMLFPYQFNCLCWKIAMLLCWILLCWMWPVPLSLDAERVTAMVLQAVLLRFCVPSENGVTPWEFCSTMFRIIFVLPLQRQFMLALWSLIKTESRTAKLRQVDSHCQGLTGKSTSEWMNQSFLLCSLPVCHFLILSFQVVCFWEKILQHDLACCLSIPCYLSSCKVLGWFLPVTVSLSPETDIWKENSKPNFIFCISSWNLFAYFCQSMQRRISCNTFLLQSIRTFWSSIWSSTVEVPFIFIDLCRFSILDVPPSGSENVPKPGLPPYEYRSPLSAVSTTCKEITWDKCYLLSMEVRVLRCSLQAWL